MKMINTVAWANTKFHRRKNVLSGMAIILTSVLVFLTITMGLGSVNTQNAAVNKIYPTWHTMYRNVSEEDKDKIAQHAAIETYGLRQDIGQVSLDEGSVILLYMDKTAQRLNKVEIDKGREPKSGNEAVFSLNTLKKLGYIQAKLGDAVSVPFQPYTKDGLGLAESTTFKIVGLMDDTEEINAKDKYSMMVSKEFMESNSPLDQRNYRMMIRLAPEEAATTTEVEKETKKIGQNFNVLESDVVVNKEYLFANYDDPAFYSGMIIIIIIVSAAGALTIYSIYYVSLISKVQEFGKLKALGATKQQVRQIVLRENLLVASIAIPIGLAIGIIAAKLFFGRIVELLQEGSVLTAMMQQVVRNNEVQLIIPWVIALSIGIALITVLVASLKPMHLASKIMPIEAMRYTGQNETQQKKRRGFLNLTLERLTKANVSRNKKRTVITIVSLGLIGTLFVTVSTVFNCMQPEEIAHQAIAEDFRLGLETWSGDLMNPEREWQQLQQNNPLTSDKIKEIEQISGVERVDTQRVISGELVSIKEPDSDKPLAVSIASIRKKQMKEVAKHIKKGSVDYEKLAGGEYLIASDYIFKNYPDLAMGKPIDVKIFDGDRSYIKQMTIVAAGRLPEKIDHSASFIASDETIQALSDNNLIKFLDIKADSQRISEVKKELEAIKGESEFYELESYEDTLKTWESATMMTVGAGYSILLVLAVVGIMNLVNTTIDSILSRKKELGVMQAIGMSNKQMRKMLQLESLFYAGGIIVMSVGIGSIVGYLIYRYAAANALMQIQNYYYPFIQVGLLILVIIVVQLLLTLATTTIVNKEPVIKRIQASE
ncbi:ABC transporter permease [Candidatus Enterococcus ferrettii]|nr:FtsX-like permease family protein [Enterococcus sp. 665A]MBO1341971.1 FtsX-like permease family protein [Enterococcus sp. 665A]